MAKTAQVSSIADVDVILEQLNDLDLKKEQLKAREEHAISKVRAAFDLKIKMVSDQISALRKLLSSFGRRRKADFEPTRTIARPFGDLAWKKAKPHVEVLEDWDEDEVLTAAEKAFGDTYVRTTKELNRQVILDAYAAKTLTDEELKSIGLAVVQDDKFHITLRREKDAGTPSAA